VFRFVSKKKYGNEKEWERIQSHRKRNRNRSPILKDKFDMCTLITRMQEMLISYVDKHWHCTWVAKLYSSVTFKSLTILIKI